jgi:hypothetical protein
MKHQKTIDKIRSQQYTRLELVKLRSNAEAMHMRGDPDAHHVVDEIDKAVPKDKMMVFMGFCPAANFDNRLDIEWREKNICTFTFLESEQQLDRFNDIWPGDQIILKKRQTFGKTMLLYGHGRVIGIKYDQSNRYLEMNWSSQDDVIEVPLMACNSTVDVRTLEQVAASMPPHFYTWLQQDQ